MHRKGEVRVAMVNNAEPEAARRWAQEAGTQFPVLVQQKWELSRRYQVFASPFAFLIDEQGTVTSKGIVNNRQQIGFVLAAALSGVRVEQPEAELGPVQRGPEAGSLTHSEGGAA
jgi:hypothetical protein